MVAAIVRLLGSGDWHETEFGTGLFRPGTPRTREEQKGGNDEEGFVRTSNRSDVVAGCVRFARSRFREGRKDFQGKVRWLPWRGRCRQSGGEVALDQGQERRRNHQGVLLVAEARECKKPVAGRCKGSRCLSGNSEVVKYPR